MNELERCKMYIETQNSIVRMLEKGLSIEKGIYMNQLVLIKNDLVASNENVRKAALNMLDFLLNLNIDDLQIEIVKILNDNTVNKIVQMCILKSIKRKVIDAISENKFNFTQMLKPWKNQNINKFTNIIEDVCLNHILKEKCKKFFIYHVIPVMMSLNTENEMRDILIDIAFILSTIVLVWDLNPKELEVFLKEVNMKYVKNIGDLRDKDYFNWHNLWIFLVRFCDKNIHSSMELTNKLLRVVEYAFRNSSVQQRLKGYDCWKELIDNASLDMVHLCSQKQIKLLMTPLKAKFSKQEVVICKRFDVFVYLLEKLQHKAVLCLPEFLEFCFGPVGENKDASKTGQGKTIPEIWTKSTKVLVDIIGHSHNKSVDCLSTEDVIKLENPVINHSNIALYYQVIINSVGECCTLLKEVDIESKRETVIKCMWKSIFSLIIPNPEVQRAKYFQVISEVLENYIKKSRENPYFEDILILIFTVLMSYDKEFIYGVIQHILKQLVTIIFTIDNFPRTASDAFKEVLSHTFSNILLVENKRQMMKEIMSMFMRLKPNDESLIHISKIWLALANELISDLTAKQIEDFVEFNDFFMWPAFQLHHLDELAKKQVVLHWMKLYRKMSLDSEKKKQTVMKELEKIFKNNPLLSSNVVSLLNVMSQFETKFTKEFVMKLMDVSSLILLLPNLKTEDEQKITALVMQYFEPSLECYNGDNFTDVIKNICVCIEHILCIHKGYKLLDTLANFIKNSPDTLKVKFSLFLHQLILDLYSKESDTRSYNAKELQKVLNVFKIKNDVEKKQPISSPFFPPTGRSARIANLAKNSPRSPRKSKKAESSPTALRLFGKDLDTLSPLSVKGSQLKKSSPSIARKPMTLAKPKIKDSPSLNEEKSSDFVFVNTEVKLQPEKLNDHQREMFNKRREDIPALYQDLSQSLSQDMFSSRSNSSTTRELKDTEDLENKKVIVEVINEPLKEENKIYETNFIVSNAIPQSLEFPEVKTEIESKPLHNNAENGFDLQNIPEASEKIPENIPSYPENTPELPNSVEVAENVENKDINFTQEELEKENGGNKKDQISQETINILKSDEDLLASASIENLKPEQVNENDMDLSGGDKLVVSHEEIVQNNHVDPEDTFCEPKDLLNKENKVEQEKAHEEISGEILKEEKDSNQISEEILTTQTQKIENNLHDHSKKSDQTNKTKSENVDKKEKRRKKIEAELQKLKMDIVGADEFVSASSRRTRTREKSQKLEETPKRKSKAGSKDRSTSQPSPSARRCLTAEKLEALLEKNRRRTIAIVIDDRNGKASPKITKDASKPNEKTLPETPKTSRKSPKLKSEQSKVISKNEMKKEIQENCKQSPKLTKKQDHSVKSPEEIKKGQKRKHSSVDADSEDIIESSQESNDDVIPIFNSSKRRSMLGNSIDEKLDKSEEKTMIQQKTVTQDDFTLDNQIESTNVNEVNIFRETEIVEKTEQTTVSQVVEVDNEIEYTGDKFVAKEVEITEKEEEFPVEIEEVMHEVEISSTIEENMDINLLDEKLDDIVEGQKEINTTQDSTLTHESAEDSTQTQETSQEMVTPDTETQCTQDTQTQDTQTQSDVGTSNINNYPPVVYFDLPKKPELTESERIMCRMDTISITMYKEQELDSRAESPHCILKEQLLMEDILSTPLSKRNQSLPSSPITVETPNRTSELLHNTLDISPISSKNRFDEEPAFDRIAESVAKNLESHVEKSGTLENEIAETQLDRKPEELEVEEENPEEIKEDKSDIIEEILQKVDEICNQEEMLNNNEEVEEIIQLTDEMSKQIVPNSNEEITEETEGTLETVDIPFQHEIKPIKENNGIQERAYKLLNMISITSPVSHKIFSKKRLGGVSMSPSTGRIKRLMSNFSQKHANEDIFGEVKEEDILTFSREVPSPLAVPRSSILKRKMSDIPDVDGISPCPKRKRVNFSDPCLTSKKVFIKEDYSRESTLEAKCLFDVLPEPKTREENVKSIFDTPDDLDTSEKLTEMENVDSEPSLQVVNPFLLKKDKPIYPKLVDCKEDVLLILKRVTSPMFITALMNKLKSKEIKTIGDLARQSETEINRFPFKVPQVANVFKALDNYYKKNVNKYGKDVAENAEGPKVNGVAEDENKESILVLQPANFDLQREFKELIRKSDSEGVPLEDLANILLPTLEKSLVLTLIKKHHNVNYKDFISNEDFPNIIKHITDTAGVSNVFKMCSEAVNGSEVECDYFNCIVNYTKSKPVFNFLENRSLDDIKVGLVESIRRNVFTKQSILETCLIPLIENPIDISSYFNKLSVVELGNVVISRLECADLRQFFRNVTEAHGSEIVLETVNKELLTSTNVIVNSFKNCISFQDAEKQTEVMVEMFKFISSKLELNTLLELHVEFLKRIPNMVASAKEN